MTVDRRTLALVHWLVAFIIFSSFFLHLPTLWDGDSYYHLAVARLYAQRGPAATIPWVRFSLLSNGADKDLLFHIVLMPFASAGDAAIGGRIALAAFNATLATIIGWLAFESIGALGFVLPIWLWIAAPPFFARIVRLRPELLALTILVLAIGAAAGRRYGWLAGLAFAFTLGYTAFHVFFAICVLWFFATKRTETRLVIAPAIGIVAGLSLRPHPIANLRLWYVQNVLFFFNTARLDVGNEIFPPPLVRTLWICSGWLLAMIAIVVIAHRSSREGQRDRGFVFALVAAIVFDVLFLRIGRMSLYAFPLTTLTIVFAFGRRVSPRALGITLFASALIAAPLNFDRDKRQFIAQGSSDVQELDLFELGKRVPAGAHVAASWSDGEMYAFWAPQGRYLNVLDPIFMAIPFPAQSNAQHRLFSGADPDIPFTTKRILDSDYLAADWTLLNAPTVERLHNDPRLEVVYGGYNLLLRVTPARSARFIADWSPLTAATDPLRGFVDATRIANGGCATLAHDETSSSPARYEFAPWGPSTLSIDGRTIASISDARAAILGHGVPFDLPAGHHTFIVRTCVAAGVAGFDLVALPLVQSAPPRGGSH